MVGRLTCHQAVVQLSSVDRDGAEFYVNDPDTANLPYVAITQENWVEMGRPDVVTITVAPGDLLNDRKPIVR